MLLPGPAAEIPEQTRTMQIAALPLVLSFSPATRVVPAPHVWRSAIRASPLRMGLFDGVKDAFGQGDKPLVAADRVTPFDKWMGLDKELVDAQRPDETAAYIDPSDRANYVSYTLSKPMGIAFVENEGGCGGVYVDKVLDTGSAAGTSLAQGDQLVAVGSSTAVLGASLDAVLEAVGASGDSTKLTLFRGPTAFLYGPTQATAEFYAEMLR